MTAFLASSFLCGLAFLVVAIPDSIASDKSCREATQLNSLGQVSCNSDLECDKPTDVCDVATYSGVAGSDSSRMCLCGDFVQVDKPHDDGICHAYVLIAPSGVASARCMPDSNCASPDPDCAFTDVSLFWKTCSCQ